MKRQNWLEKIKNNNILSNILALFLGILIIITFLFCLEMALRFKYDDLSKFYFSLNPKLLNHVAIFRRSLLPSADDTPPRVFCLGGSTTNGCNMPISRSYPNILNALFKVTKTPGNAYNFGVSGVSAVTTNFFIKNILPQYKPNCVVIHDGYNDLPIVVKKVGEDKFQYVKPDYYNTFNPHIKNPVLRYCISFIKFNLRSTRRLVVTFVKRKLHMGGDLFLGFDYKKYNLIEGTSSDILEENLKRINIMIKKEIDSIDYCLANNTKVIVILEPYIKPYHYVYPFKTGFRDENVGEILSECHKIQQSMYLLTLAEKYKNNKNVVILDVRQKFKGRYNELFYDECHLNGKGNTIKAQYVFIAIKNLFSL